MKLFQIEEPDGSPVDPDAPGAAIGIDLTAAQAEVAVAVGGNAVILADRDGFAIDLPVPGPDGSVDDWRRLFEGVRLRAERALAQPVTHAVFALIGIDPAVIERVGESADAAGLWPLDFMACDPAETGRQSRACDAAILAEELVPRPTAE
jgi:hypothetical protein